MGQNAKIRLLTRALKEELKTMNKDLTKEQQERLFVIARKKMLAEMLNQRASKKPDA